MKLILASNSARRSEVLRNAGIGFEAIAPRVDESRLPGEAAEAYVRRLAGEKAAAVASLLPTHEPAIIVGADTVVLAEGQILGKPGSPDDARRMLRLLSGRSHTVITGLGIL